MDNGSNILHDSIVIKRNPNQVFSIIDDEVVMLSIKNGEYYSLNKVGSEIWKFLSEPREFKTIIKYLSQEYDSNESNLSNDTSEFLYELIQVEVLEIVDDDI